MVDGIKNSVFTVHRFSRSWTTFPLWLRGIQKLSFDSTAKKKNKRSARRFRSFRHVIIDDDDDEEWQQTNQIVTMIFRDDEWEQTKYIYMRMPCVYAIVSIAFITIMLFFLYSKLVSFAYRQLIIFQYTDWEATARGSLMLSCAWNDDYKTII